MDQWKRKGAILLSLFLLLSLVTACGGEKKTEKGTGPKKERTSSGTEEVKEEVSSPPKITLLKDYVITNDPDRLSAADLCQVTSKKSLALYLGGWEKISDLVPQTEEDRKTIIHSFTEASVPDLLRREGTPPTEEGIYSAVLKAKDAEGNAGAQEILVICDKTPPVFSGIEDEEVEVEKGEEPIYTVPDGIITDNYDGAIPGKAAEVSLKKTGGGSYAASITVFDQAGNSTTAQAGLTVTNAGESAPPASAQAPAAASPSSEKDYLSLLNAYRKEKGVSPLKEDPLGKAPANARASDITRSLSHRRPDGTWYYTYIDRAGIPYRVVGESLAGGVTSFADALSAWKASAPDQKNLLDPSFTSCAIGEAEKMGKKYYVLLLFG